MHVPPSLPAPVAPLLLVDDHPPNLLALEAVLAPLGQPLVKVTSGEAALKALLVQDFACVLLDVQMPGLSGLETATLIKQRKRSAATPILFLTAGGRDAAQLQQAYARGAVDYIVKPFDPDVLRAKVAVFVDLHQRSQRLQREEAELRRRERELLERESAARVQAAVQTEAQRQAEARAAELVAQQQWLEGLLHRLPVPLLLVEAGTGRFTFANAAADALWGGSFPRAGSREEHARAFAAYDAHGQPLRSEEAPSARAARGERLQGVQLSLETPRGLRALLVDTEQLPALNDRPAMGVVTFQDITGLKAVERALQEREQEYRTLAESMPQVVWTAGPHGLVDYMNAALAGHVGSSVEALLGEGWVPFVHPEDLASSQAGWERSQQTGAPYEVHVRLRGQDGAYRWFLARATCMRDAQGRPLKWFGTATDIDAAKRSEASSRFLAEASALLGGSLDHEATLQQVARLAIPALADWCSVDILDEGGRVRRLAVAHADPTRVQQAVELARRYPLDLEEAHGVARVLRTGQSDWMEALPDAVLEAAAQGDPERLRLTRELGLRSYVCVPLLARGRVLGALSLVYAESGRRYGEADLRLAEDLGRRAGLAVDNARLYAESQAAVRLRDEFLGVASHELKTPLTPLHLKVQALQKRLAAQPETPLPAQQVASVLAAVSAQTRKLTLLINGLLDVSRVSAGKLEVQRAPVDLTQLVREVAGAFENEAAKVGSALQLQLPDAPVVGQWDPLRLEQVVTNLLANALKYGAGRPVSLEVEATAERAQLRVRDQGIGIAPEAQARIFEKFERAVSDRHYGGLGLGLYITREIVHALGGQVEVQSAPGLGARFDVRLPLQAP